MPVYRTQFRIEAPAAHVWTVLSDFASYADWNPSLPSIAGDLQPGAVVNLTLGMPGRPSMQVRATLQEVVVGERLTWLGHVGADWFFRGYREFAISPIGEESAELTHVEDVTGAMAPVFGAFMGGAAQRGHDAFNDALRRRCEGAA